MAPILGGVAGLPGLLAIGLVRAYQVLALPFPSPCRYEPTCSTYAIDALRKYGLMRGFWLGIRRILRCHPFSRGGIDLVP